MRDTICRTFTPLYWADEDTDDTIKGVKAHNRVYVGLCPSTAFQGAQ